MCQFFSFITEPECHGGKRFYFDWDNRQQFNFDDRRDSHSSIATFYLLNEDKCNKYEYNPLTGEFEVDQINSDVDDSIQAEEWVRKLNFKKVVEPLIVKPIVHPFRLPKVEKVTDEQVKWLKQWDSVMDSVWASVWASVGESVWASVGDSVRAYTGSFLSLPRSAWKYTDTIDCEGYPFQSAVTLWELGLVPSFDGEKWRLHGGPGGRILWEGVI